MCVLCARIAVGLIVAGAAVCGTAWALPSPRDHVHDADTVDWRRIGAPALPWTNDEANENNHQHLTTDGLDERGRYYVSKAWDDRTLHSLFSGAPAEAYAHGFISPDRQVRYFADASVPGRGRDIIGDAYREWQAKAREQYFSHREPWDAIALGFIPGSLARHDIRVLFDPNLDAYGNFSSATREIRFLSNPTMVLGTGSDDIQIRLVDPADGRVADSGSAVDLPLGWSFDGFLAGDPGRPAVKTWDIDYRMRPDPGSPFGGWQDDPVGGLTDLAWAAARSDASHTVPAADTLTVSGMDFRTIAAHEIGHSVALGHPLDPGGTYRQGTVANPNPGPGPAGKLMRWDIGDFAVLGQTRGIDTDSALAVAIDYTWSAGGPFLDFGDAPDSYLTYLGSNGPRYGEGALQRLGVRWDAEPDGQPTPMANGDDVNYWGVGGPDDEDGVVFGESWVDVTLDIARAGLNEYSLRAWWDLNENGFFDHVAELIIDDILALTPGQYLFHYDLGFDPRPFFSRFRLTWIDDPLGVFGGVSRTTDITPWGEFLGADGLSHGEVEDYVPEPSSLALLGAGLWGLWRRPRRGRDAVPRERPAAG